MNGILFIWDGFLFLSLSLPSVLLFYFVMILRELLAILTYLQLCINLDRSEGTLSFPEKTSIHLLQWFSS